jgi:hypothetical protein
MVEQLTHDPKLQGLNPVIVGTKQQKAWNTC